MPPTLFVSHSSKDDDAVTRLHDALTVAGIDAWVDHKDILPGHNFDTSVQNALNACDAGLLALSPDSAIAEACLAECWFLLNQKKPLYVALIRPVSPQKYPWRLGVIQYADLTRDFDAGVRSLSAAVLGRRPLDPHAATTATAPRLSGPRFPFWQLDLPLIGRDDALAAVQAALADRQRGAAILGVGGVGKTRLAAEIAMRNTFADGAVWHDIRDYTALTDLTLLLRDHLGLDLTTPEDAVWAEVGRRQVLIVLDNAEDCRQPQAYAARLNALDTSGGSRVLVTSRRAWPELRHLKQIPLRAPDPQAAVAILRAMIAQEPPAFSLDDWEARIAEAARHHPRLMEYAVRWANSYPPDYVVETLRDLKGADADEALDDLVRRTVRLVEARPGGPEAVAALRRLLVCRGGFSFEAARALIGAEPQPLALLQQGGLVFVVEGGRYDFDPLLLPALGEDPDAYRAHYDYYLALARKHDQAQDYAGLDVESANLEIAFERAMTAGDGDAAYWLANACSAFLGNRGRFAQRMDWLTRAAAALIPAPSPSGRGDEGDARTWAAAQDSLGSAYREHPFGDRRANLRRAAAAYAEALRFVTPQAAPLAYAATQHNLGLVYAALSALEDRAGNLRRAAAAYAEALRFVTPQAAPLAWGV